VVDATKRNAAYAVFRWVLYKFVPDVHRQECLSKEKILHQPYLGCLKVDVYILDGVRTRICCLVLFVFANHEGTKNTKKNHFEPQRHEDHRDFHREKRSIVGVDGNPPETKY
jgi:hypothetical protein